jgi:hypothetical protein
LAPLRELFSRQDAMAQRIAKEFAFAALRALMYHRYKSKQLG